ncbi:MAG TPA: N,N-dimethylformamidase beta subunit family domain-containing protein [Gaiella sp.]|nr:N,N-dimethylformamidase beta subunit family domain-containing protein [Gaiella sp.]
MTGTWNRLNTARVLAALLALTSTAVVALRDVSVAPDGVSHETAVDEEEHEGRAPTEIELTPSVEAAFRKESYAPGTTARLVVWNRAGGLTVQLFRVGNAGRPTVGNVSMEGVAVTRKLPVGSSAGRLVVPIAIGDWPSGLYFARLDAKDGRAGFAPFVVRPAHPGTHQVAVVMPTLTWQSYNLRDDDRDGQGDSWYARWKHHTVRLARPFLNRGVPSNFRRYDLPFLEWLARTGREVEVLAQADVEASNARELARSYDLIVFPGHHEYVTTREYDVIEGYRDLGGNMAFLSANNFFWQVVRHGDVMEKTKQWRDLARPEAALLGVQYRGNDRGEARASWVVRDAPAVAWLFAGTHIRPGDLFGEDWGIEIDQTSSASPRNVQVIAELPDLFGPGFTAQMTYYETRGGAKVFAAGAFTLAGQAREPAVPRVLANLWARLARP